MTETGEAPSGEDLALGRAFSFIIANGKVRKRIGRKPIQRLQNSERQMALRAKRAGISINEAMRAITELTEMELARVARTLLAELTIAFNEIARAAREKEENDDSPAQRTLF